jgi:uncharacterized SAM-binding protein YcdF (DUF218 family)
MRNSLKTLGKFPVTAAAIVAAMLLRYVIRALASLGLLFVMVTVTPVLEWWSSALAGPWTEARGDVLIVLGSEGQPDGIIGESSYWRAVYAIRAWRQGGFREIVVSGAGVADAMRDFMVNSGVPAAAIRVETQAGSTRENALFVARMLADTPGRKVLLTSDYHMFRAYRAFRKAGMNVEPRPFPDAGKRVQRWERRWGVFLGLGLETGKIGYYWARRWI